MIKTIFVIVHEMEEAEDFQVVEVLQRRAFTDKAKAQAACDKLTADFGKGFSVVPLTIEDLNGGTVNVIETINGVPQSLRSYFDNEKGNAAAEKIFRRLVREHVAGVQKFSNATLDSFIEDGVYDDEQGYCLFLTHSME